MNELPAIDVGDNVRVLASPETDAAKISGLVGQVYGFTTPSATGVSDVIGGPDGDCAINVNFDEHGAIWINPRLIEFVDHAPSTEITIGDKRFMRSASGEWIDPDAGIPRKPWWKFW